MGSLVGNVALTVPLTRVSLWWMCVPWATGQDPAAVMALASSYNSIYLNGNSATSARVSCGGLLSLTDAVLEGHVRNGFAIIRPPGHHAEHDQAM